MNRVCKKVNKYHFKDVNICVETDKVFTQCYSCGEWKPSTTEFFRKDADKNRQRDFRPLCKKCANKQLRDWKAKKKHEQEMEKMTHITSENIHSDPLFKEKDDEKKVSLESKIQKILDYLGL